MSLAIEITGATKRFGVVTALDRVDLRIESGEFITLLGPSGCGKTTLLRLLSGFETPDEGRILIGGEDVTDLPPYRRNVNQVFQSYALFPHLTVRENVAFGLRMQKVAKAETERRVGEVLRLVALESMEDRRPDQLSGGQRQRVALARAIVPRPAVLLLDEPLSALDAKLRRAMQLELKHLQRQLGITFVFVTHDQEEALTMSDRIAVFNRGRIEQVGTADEIYHHPASSFVAEFVGETNVIEAAIRSAAPGSLTVVLADGAIATLPVAGAVPPGARAVRLSLRPEKIRIGCPVAPDGIGLVAIVRERVFQGPTVKVRLQLPGGSDWFAMQANAGLPPGAFNPGDEVSCVIQSDDLVPVGWVT